ncbi:MAG: nucleotidyl transferase AbiEii/AbiGii toxin family protein [Candidatus Latescibacterota bacterium]
MTFHDEVLSQAQVSALAALGPVLSPSGFYLGGGTAVAIHLGHRRSEDLDWFTEETLADPMRLAADLRAEGVDLETRQVARGTLHAAVGGVRVSFMEYRHARLSPTVSWPLHGCWLASRDDLACMKLAAVAQRGARKDFLDLYALGLHHRGLVDMLALYRRRYAVADIAHVLYGLTYFDDAEGEPAPIMLWDVSWEEVKAAVREWVAEAAA